MPFILTEPTSKEYSVDSINIISFSIDLEDMMMYVTYEEMSGGIGYDRKTIAIEDDDFMDIISSTNALAEVDVYGIMKTSLYNHIAEVDGYEGEED